MIETRQFYAIRCDGCGEYLKNENDFPMWDEKDAVEFVAKESGWLKTDDGKHYCQKCHNINDNDIYECKGGKFYNTDGTPYIEVDKYKVVEGEFQDCCICPLKWNKGCNDKYMKLFGKSCHTSHLVKCNKTMSNHETKNCKKR